ncbi:MAG: sulfurtransferase complex subunit TusB [gamma proteobacterium symbiont of Bathyaustriella thionipta]|nr:sulfurtransferase complex subunit TusB [gamma proteobacterium symbiont of Bathyaustriella thionipta]MCU7948524.1 sulfurtransferase complex subunit TusB [gamma proteobacterium symbiont of Bathyaustriella thionipta]MCU7953831.1 sulfurtransferase complex subunit TusB [gamma proteobacterium symbiont of Bathyaustriella thionipta]MCU7955059.1 sulfurtransferase complex subunit TusB [gamma proteobacterium symbiont of Bathyaustriella thionipta]MCU7967612.1 sulfurtransferase complex subunit TusB [gamm
MAMLHTVNKSPFERSSLNSCLNKSKEGSSILLIEDAVVGALKGTKVADDLSAAIANKNVYVLGSDLNTRGFTEADILDGIKTVDYAGFVDLVAEHSNVQSWL